MAPSGPIFTSVLGAERISVPALARAQDVPPSVEYFKPPLVAANTLLFSAEASLLTNAHSASGLLNEPGSVEANLVKLLPSVYL